MRILLATDGSRSAEAARDLVALMSWPAGTTIRIVSIAPRGADLATRWTPETAHEPDLDRYRDPVVRTHAVALANAERDLGLAHPGARIERFLLRGRPASLIVQEARDFAADLIVVGHRGHGTIETMVLGSVSAEVVDHAPCPVLVARSAERGPDRRSRTTGRRAPGSRRPSSNACPCRPTPRSRSSRSPTPVFRTRRRPHPALYGAAMAQYGESMGDAGRESHDVASAGAARLEQLGYRANTRRARRRSGARDRGLHEGVPDGAAGARHTREHRGQATAAGKRCSQCAPSRAVLRAHRPRVSGPAGRRRSTGRGALEQALTRRFKNGAGRACDGYCRMG